MHRRGRRVAADTVSAVVGAKFEDAVVISGIGQSEVGRRLDRSPLAITIDAITAAITDAGLDAADVDGIASYPGGGTSLGAGFAGPDVAEVCDALRLEATVVNSRHSVEEATEAAAGLLAREPRPTAVFCLSDSIACGVYGWMFHTRYFRTLQEASQDFELMKAGLSSILDLIPVESDPEAEAKSSCVVNAIEDFVARFP